MQAHDDSLNLFCVQPTNKAISQSQMIEHLPISQLSSGCVEFSVTSQNFIDFSRSHIQLRCKIVIGENDPIKFVESLEKYDATGDVAPTNCLIASMFQKVDLSLQHQSISNDIPTYCYPYKYMLDTLLTSKVDEQLGILFTKDLSTAINTCSNFKAVAGTDNAVTDGNPALKKRTKFVNQGQEFVMTGSIGVDFMKQKRLLLHNTNIGLKFWPSTPEFSLLSSELSQKFNIKILDAKLVLCHVTLDPAVGVAISDALKLKSAQYPYINSKMRTHTIAKGSQVATINDLFGTECPEQLIVCMAKSAAVSGSFHHNPYFFSHFNISEIGLYLNNISLPAKPLQVKFGDTAYQSHYLEAWQRLHRLNPDSIISFEDFHRGYTIFCFDLGNRENFEELLPISHTGTTKLELRFSKALEDSIVVFLYGKFKGLLSIDAARNITTQ